MEPIFELFNQDITSLILGVFIVMAGIIAMVNIIGKFSEIVGKPVKWVKKKEQDHELLVSTATNLKCLQDEHEKSVKKSIDGDRLIKEDLDKLTGMMEEHILRDNDRTIVTLRSTLYRLHGEFVKQNYVTQEGLKTFVECGKVYSAAGGDDIFHTKLEPEVLALKIKD